MNMISDLWVDKWCPTTLDDYVLNEDLKNYFRAMLSKQTVQNCTFSGIQGQGKTTLAKLICNSLDAEVLFVKCATEGTVDVVRSKIEPFCNAMSIEGKLKIVILDEIDSSSSGGGNSFQMAMRTVIEAAQDDTRFICTCNFSNKVLPALLSRCPIIPLKFDKKDLLIRIKTILDAEHIECTKEDLKTFIEDSFQYYPDCRRIIGYLQMCCNSGKLIVKLNDATSKANNDFLDALLDEIKKNPKVMEVRQFYLHNKQNIDDFKTVSGELFNKAIDKKVVCDARAILKMSDIIYQMNLVVNPEIQFFALICLIHASCHQQ